MTNTGNIPPGADDETIVERPDTVEVQRVVTTNDPRVLPDEVIPPQPGGAPVDPLVPTVVTEDERPARGDGLLADRQVHRAVDAPKAVELFDLLLERADPPHELEGRQQALARLAQEPFGCRRLDVRNRG